MQLTINWQKFNSLFDWETIVQSVLSKIGIIVVASILLLIIKKISKVLILHFFKKYREKYSKSVSEKRIDTFTALSLNVLSYVIWFLWFYWILSAIGVPIGTLIASAGVFSLALGLGAQGFVTDIVSGFFILLEKQVEVGEYVNINNIKGTVVAVGLRTTQIVSDDGTLNFIPNRSIQTISNMSRNDMVAIVQIGIVAETPIDKALKVINDLNKEKVAEYSDILSEPNVLGVVTLPDGKLAIQVNFTTKNGAQFKIQHEFLKFYLRALNDNDIKIAPSPMIYK
ncbi:mechanosensitive ion channel family protein [Lentilactobacillus sp. Marseille-Q4993]|uniref:mechanosensitive ion channel family protein n=1 Tax=Lentilactobacillus sp. Marseille-Q4993 TaxID=3039492 RepID=UPI0024BC9631|nr:mechanosensitive ion channel family protein [Lentilactobacillus sp. Marseille-Q4993]